MQRVRRLIAARAFDFLFDLRSAIAGRAVGPAGLVAADVIAVGGDGVGEAEVGHFDGRIVFVEGWVGRGDEDVGRFEVAVDDLFPFGEPVGCARVAEGAVGEGVGEAVEDVPEEGFGEDEAVGVCK